MYVIITVHVRGVGVCWCVCAIAVLFSSGALVCARSSVRARARVRPYPRLSYHFLLNAVANIEASVNSSLLTILINTLNVFFLLNCFMFLLGLINFKEIS